MYIIINIRNCVYKQLWIWLGKLFGSEAHYPNKTQETMWEAYNLGRMSLEIKDSLDLVLAEDRLRDSYNEHMSPGWMTNWHLWDKKNIL